jgi:hypothetical protein
MRKNQKRDGFVKTTLYLDRLTAQCVKEEALKRGVSQQSILVSTIKDRYDPEFEIVKGAYVADRLNRLDRHLRSVLESCSVISESHAAFVKMWLVNTPEVDPIHKEKAIDSARKRYEKYLRAIANVVGEDTLRPWEDSAEIELKDTHFVPVSNKTERN